VVPSCREDGLATRSEGTVGGGALPAELDQRATVRDRKHLPGRHELLVRGVRLRLLDQDPRSGGIEVEGEGALESSQLSASTCVENPRRLDVRSIARREVICWLVHDGGHGSVLAQRKPEVPGQ